MTQLNFTEALSSANRGVEAAAKTLALVREFPYRTARELAYKINGDVLSADNIHKRLPELRRAGSVLNGQRRRCTITGRSSVTWVAA